MRMKATLLLLIALITPHVDCAITWVAPVGGNGPCGNVDENSEGNLDQSTDVEATTDGEGVVTYDHIISVEPAGIELEFHGQGNFHQASGTIDYETATTMVVVFEVSDDAEPPTTSTGTCTIVVNDLNDNVPTFPVDATAEVANNAAAGTVVTDTFTATDADGSAPNNEIANYAITAGDHGDLVVDATSGAISVATGQTTDCHTRLSYTLTVEATDGGDPALTGSGTLQVTVTGDGCPTATTPESETTTGGGDGTTTGGGDSTTTGDGDGTTTADPNKSTTHVMDGILVLLMTLAAGVGQYIL